MTLADKAEFKSDLRQRKCGLFQQKTCPFNPPQHHKAVRATTHRLPEEPGELVSPDASVITLAGELAGELTTPRGQQAVGILFSMAAS